MCSSDLGIATAPPPAGGGLSLLGGWEGGVGRLARCRPGARGPAACRTAAGEVPDTRPLPPRRPPARGLSGGAGARRVERHGVLRPGQGAPRWDTCLLPPSRRSALTAVRREGGLDGGWPVGPRADSDSRSVTASGRAGRLPRRGACARPQAGRRAAPPGFESLAVAFVWRQRTRVELARRAVAPGGWGGSRYCARRAAAYRVSRFPQAFLRAHWSVGQPAAAPRPRRPPADEAATAEGSGAPRSAAPGRSSAAAVSPRAGRSRAATRRP